MAKKKTPDFEEQMQRLHAIVQQLERMELPLEQSVALYKEGRALAASCKSLLDHARNEVLLCGKDGMTEFPAKNCQGAGEDAPELTPAGQEDFS